MEKEYWMFIGDKVEHLDQKEQRFVVETSGPIPREGGFQGMVAFANESSPHEVGHDSDYWSNPFCGGFPYFIQVKKEYAKANFKFEYSPPKVGDKFSLGTNYSEGYEFILANVGGVGMEKNSFCLIITKGHGIGKRWALPCDNIENVFCGRDRRDFKPIK